MHGGLVLSEVSIRDNSNLDIPGVMFDSKLIFECIVSRVSRGIGILRFVKRIFVDTVVLLRCYYAFILRILEYCVLRYWGQLLNVTLCLRRHVAGTCMLLKVN